mgnify:CR=1 FL=1
MTEIELNADIEAEFTDVLTDEAMDREKVRLSLACACCR